MWSQIQMKFRCIIPRCHNLPDFERGPKCFFSDITFCLNFNCGAIGFNSKLGQILQAGLHLIPVVVNPLPSSQCVCPCLFGGIFVLCVFSHRTSVILFNRKLSLNGQNVKWFASVDPGDSTDREAFSFTL